jgi:hypothetical protein
MTTPYGKLALERGEECKDDVTGELLTEEMFARDKEKNLRILPRTGDGLLAFKKEDDGEGYRDVKIPLAALKEISEGKVKRLQLEDGQ